MIPDENYPRTQTVVVFNMMGRDKLIAEINKLIADGHEISLWHI